MISVERIVRPSLVKSYIARNGGTGDLNALFIAQTGTGKKKNEIQNSWLAAKGGTGKGSAELWGSYLATKGFTTGSLKERMKAFFTSGTQS